jgi:tetratricopeptide (TPR) repeat protein
VRSGLRAARDRSGPPAGGGPRDRGPARSHVLNVWRPEWGASEAAPQVDLVRVSASPWLFLGGVATVQAVFVALNVAYPEWRLVDLDEEHNLPTYFQVALLATASLSAAYALRVEGVALTRAGHRRAWALLSWVGATLLFAGMALDEALVLHEEFNGEAARAWFRAASPVQGTVVWLILLSPAMIGAFAGLLGWILARRTLSPAFARLGLTAIGLWLMALVFEGTAKSVFIPLNLYRLEVAFEESGEALAPAVMCLAIWAYVRALRAYLAGRAPGFLAQIRVPWRTLTAATAAAIGVPAVIVAGSVLLNPAVRLKAVADEHLKAGRFGEAAATYRAVVGRSPRWARAWDRLGVAEYRRGNLAEAGDAFSAAARLSPRNASVLQHVGAVLYQQGRYADALEPFQRAAALEPADPGALRNLASTLARLGRNAEAEALRARASRIAPEAARVIAMQVSFPAELALAYLAAPGLEPALAHTRAGQVDAALASYRALLGDARSGAAAHLGFANELVRWRVAVRLTAAQEPIRVPDSELSPVRPTALFSDWIRRPDGRWDSIESVVAAPTIPADARALTQEAQRHYDQALTLGAGAAAHVGLVILALENGETEEAARQLAAARALDPSLPPALLNDLTIRIARP